MQHTAEYITCYKTEGSSLIKIIYVRVMSVSLICICVRIGHVWGIYHTQSSFALSSIYSLV